MLAFQNCGKVSFSSSPDNFSKAGALGDLDTTDDGLFVPAPEDGEEAVDQDDEDDVECIGNGIKVPTSTLVACEDGSMKCLVVCHENITRQITFEEGRSLIPNGATPGICQ